MRVRQPKGSQGRDFHSAQPKGSIDYRLKSGCSSPASTPALRGSDIARLLRLSPSASSLPRKDGSAPPLLSNYIRVATARPMASTKHVPTDSAPMATV
ncbi:hypothetical protein AOLI_G00167460 [Acnodon oligacanthus]